MNNVTEFLLLGLTQSPEVQKLLFALFTLLCFLTVAGDLLITVTVATSRALGSPMHFFLSFLSFIDCCCSSTMAPKMIFDLLAQKKAISFSGCMTQLFAEHFFGGVEILLLMVRACDRHVVCKPLQCAITVNRHVCGLLVAMAWAGGFLHSLFQIIFIGWLSFCGPSVIDHFICELFPLLKLSCIATHVFGLFVAANSGLMCMLIFSILITSYVLILCSLRIHSTAEQQKAPSTCASHVAVAVLFFVACMFVYLRPTITFPIDKALAVLYTMVTPMLNPLIYTLRNSEVKNAMKTLWSQRVTLGNNFCE
ncbi:LOW QUALITY PROTEIN: olfactory receptor 4C5-like [Dama dama]